MNQGDVLSNLIDEDFGIRKSNRYYRAIEHNSLVLDYEDGIFYWNSEQIFGGPLDYLLKVRNLPLDIAKQLLQRYGTLSDKQEFKVSSYNDVVTYLPLAKQFWSNGKNNREYWYKRLLTDKTIDRLYLGKHEQWNTVPSILDGNLLNIQLRTDGPEKQIRQWYSGTGPSPFNFNILGLVDTVIFCEGVVDSILLSQEGLPSVSVLGGSGSWKNEWFKYFINVRLIYLLFDNDNAGREGAKKISKMIGEYRTKIYTFDGYKDKYDVIDFFRDGGNKKDLLKILESESEHGFKIS